VAVGLANKKMVPKLSKGIDMRFHWVQDRVKQGQFIVRHILGEHNVTEYFTKPLPFQKHQQ
jgi:hypothetical protein